MTAHVKVASNGRLVLPADVRRRLGLENGGDLLIEETDEGIILSTQRHNIHRAQALYRQFAQGAPGISVDDFIAERRSEHAREHHHDQSDGR